MCILESKKYLIIPINQDIINIQLDNNLIESWKNSLLLYANLNILYSFENFMIFCQNSENKVYLIKDKENNNQIFGIIGFRFIDLIQKKAELIIIYDDKTRKGKLLYEPLKLLLKKAIEDWNIRLVTTNVYSTDVFTPTMLKGFGFQLIGTIKENIHYKDEYLDIDLYYLINKYFHSLNNDSI